MQLLGEFLRIPEQNVKFERNNCAANGSNLVVVVTLDIISFPQENYAMPSFSDMLLISFKNTVSSSCITRILVNFDIKNRQRIVKLENIQVFLQPDELITSEIPILSPPTKKKSIAK